MAQQAMDNGEFGRSAKRMLRRSPLVATRDAARVTREEVKASEEKFYALSKKEGEARRAKVPEYEELKEEAMKAFEDMERLRRIYASQPYRIKDTERPKEEF